MSTYCVTKGLKVAQLLSLMALAASISMGFTYESPTSSSSVFEKGKWRVQYPVIYAGGFFAFESL